MSWWCRDFVVKENSGLSLSKVELINPCIMLAEFQFNLVTIIINCYCPSNTSRQDQVDNFYRKLKLLYSDILSHNVLMVCFEFDSKPGNVFLDSYFTAILTEMDKNSQNSCLGITFKPQTQKSANNVRNCLPFSSFKCLPCVLAHYTIISVNIMYQILRFRKKKTRKSLK